jgi:glycosyltransferase involved in cell wall biosynthesis
MLKDRLTVVIPNKNEGKTLETCLYHLSKQLGIDGTKVIIADSSDKGQEPNFSRYRFPELDIEITIGGLPSAARRNGSLLAKTPYILFLDADMFLTNRYLFLDIIAEHSGDFDLLTIPFRTDIDYDWGYRLFDIIQWFTHKAFGHPFAIGGFQLFFSQAYWEIGGYDPYYQVAEDYCISLKIKPKRFIVHKVKDGVYTSSRRFKNKGIWYMVKLMFRSFINRNNPLYFHRSHGYWE